jgi:hypothetical protein
MDAEYEGAAFGNAVIFDNRMARASSAACLKPCSQQCAGLREGGSVDPFPAIFVRALNARVDLIS